YKTRIMKSEERMITADTVTTCNKNDGKELETLMEKSKEASMEVNTVIGSAAYAEKGNIKYTNKNEVEVVAKLNPITQGTRTKEDEFEFNKDAGMYVCKAGHMAIRKARQGKKNVGKN